MKWVLQPAADGRGLRNIVPDEVTKFGGRSAPTPENFGGRVVSVWSRD
jgi:hypothetical protein